MKTTFTNQRTQTGPGTTSSTTWLGAVLIALTGLIHLVEAPEYWGEVHYIGALFGVTAIGAAAAVLGILRMERWGWLLGSAIAGANALAYVLSRTIGIPRFREASLAQFLEPVGLVSLLVELLFLVLALRVLLGNGGIARVSPYRSAEHGKGYE